ncbi:Double Clp-N motif-containing P-loop nucleoside triphosphate hydrolases superfamily protein [Prunus dulcis]|uniref:Double Clp-N motif-containing P-loop nucleoside triphosphate hydrolases superfamily protein n=1 Tax=Prunus dulcis TaxID=3755 RepID=A0A4Y1R1R9_PRUDU|nr:Double Clp-N motif-containing P-loop nucleoside triphosphate hydrolases superfamily protein [Prunus dulcis]
MDFLMESFVPFGGFFSAPSDLNLPISSSYQCVPRNHPCNEKCGQEAYAAPKGGVAASVAGQHQASLPSWLQMAPLGINKGIDTKSPEDKKDNQGNNTDISSNKTECKNTNSCMPIDVQTKSGVPPQATNDSFSSEVWENPSKDEDLESGGLRSPSLSNSSVVDGSRTSATSTTSVTTDLGLGICSSPASNTANKPPNQNQGLKQDISGCFSCNVDLVNGNLYSVQSSSCSSLDNHGQFDPSDVKVLFRALFERVGWQIEAISVISQRIAHCRSRSENFVGASHRRDIWFNFSGPDRYGKKKTAVALAEVLYGGQEQLIRVDLDSQDGMIHSDTILDCQAVNGYDVKFRGKTVVDYVAGELCKKPLSIVFLENVDKADAVTRNCLSLALSTGKFLDSHGRQVSTSNAIFVTTSKFSKGCSNLTSTNGPSNYSEERILQAKGRSVQITIECSFEDSMAISQNWRASSNTTKEGISNQHLLNKRKLTGVNEPLEQHEVSEMPKRANKTSTRYLDLNLPAEETAAQDTDGGSSENDCPSENSKPWLQEFFEKVDDTVVFKPVDFDALAEKISKEIKNSFHKFVDTECLLEIDSKVMEQLLAAVYLTDRYKVVETWVEQVLSRGFAEVQKRYSSNAITMLKLKTCEGLCLEQPAPKTLLLPSIMLK